jgi:hypothetical protein
MIDFNEMFLALSVGSIFWFITFIIIINRSIKTKSIEMSFMVSACLLAWSILFIFNYNEEITKVDQLMYFIFTPIILVAYQTYKNGHKQLPRNIKPLTFKLLYTIIIFGFTLLIKLWIENNLLNTNVNHPYLDSGIKTLLIINFLFSLSSLNLVLRSIYFNNYSKIIACFKLISATFLNGAIIFYFKSDIFIIFISSLIFIFDVFYLK